MTPWLMFWTWFVLGMVIGTFLAHRKYNGGYWTDELEWWLWFVIEEVT